MISFLELNVKIYLHSLGLIDMQRNDKLHNDLNDDGETKAD